MKRTVACWMALIMVFCMSLAVLSASAADSDFAPSIEEKPVPEIVAPEVDDNADLGEIAPEDVGAVINKGGDEAKEYIGKSHIVTLFYDKAVELVENKEDNELSPEEEAVCNTLIDAYEALRENGVRNSVEAIDEFVSENLDVANPEYFVSHIFELNLGDDHSDKLQGEASATVRFDNTSIRAEAGKFVVAHMVEDKWVIVPNEDVTVTEAYVEVTFDSLCPIVFLNVEEGEEETTADTTVPGGDESESESKGEETQKPDDDKDDGTPMTAIIIIVCITVVIAAGIVVFFILEKKGVLAKISKKDKK